MNLINHAIGLFNNITYSVIHADDSEQRNYQPLFLACATLILGIGLQRCLCPRRRVPVKEYTPVPVFDLHTTPKFRASTDYVYSPTEAAAIAKIHEIAYQFLDCSKERLAQQQALLLVIHARIPDLDFANKILSKAIQESPKQIPSQQSMPTAESQRTFPSWDTVMKFDPETIVTVTHGGGIAFLKAFLAGENQGYASEAGGRGIFVTPDVNAELPWIQVVAEQYACITPIKYHDTPGIMEAKIRAKHLRKVNRNQNAAVILPEQRTELFDVVIRDLSDQMRSFYFRKKYCGRWLPISSIFTELNAQGYSEAEVTKMKRYWAEFTDKHPDERRIL